MVAHWKELQDGENPGYFSFPSPSAGVFRWRIWDHHQTSWRKGATHNVVESMHQADEALAKVNGLILCEGYPTATNWKFMTDRSDGRLARYVWDDPSCRVSRYAMLVTVSKIRKEFGGGWTWAAFASATATPERLPAPRFKTRREAKTAADAWLQDEGWVLRTR